MDRFSRESRGIWRQLEIVVAVFQQNDIPCALKLIRPILLRRLVEIAHLLLGPLKFFSPRQRLLRDFIARNLKYSHDPRLDALGNYAAFTSLLSPKSVVYSFGVGGDIRFDIDLIAAASSAVYLFDPTPRSARFMKRYPGNARLQFYPWGIWTTGGPVRFFSDDTLAASAEGTIVREPRSGSITNITGAQTWFVAECHTLRSIMSRLGHQKIDLLKMDIEGAALDIMEQLLGTEVRPAQIIVEFEIPRTTADIEPFLHRVERLIQGLTRGGYTLHAINRREIHIDSIELLAARL
jgi:FkbM family methyltransferase